MSSILKDIRAAFGDVEPAPYTVVVQRGGYEERVYPARWWACTSMSGPSRHELVTPMFRRLFSYISGRNEPNVRIDMTTPVVTYVEPQQNEEDRRGRRKSSNKGGGKSGGGDIGGGTDYNSITTSTSTSPSLTYTMSFLVPASHQDAAPPTADRKIFFERRKKMLVLCRRFSGYLNDDVVKREMANLREALRNSGEDDGLDFDRYFVVGYDPPFKLLGRRNEIWVVKKVWEPEEEEEIKMEKGTCGDFVLVEKEEGNDELMVVNGVVKAKDEVGKDVVVENGFGASGVEDDGEKNEVVKDGMVVNGDVEERAMVMEANGAVGKENGEVVLVETVK